MKKFFNFLLVIFFFNILIANFKAISAPKCQGDDGIYSSSQCFAIVRYEDGSKYSGDFKSGKRQGFGTMIYSNGSKYVGMWNENDYTKGQGGFIEGNGLKGRWIEGKAEIKYADGRIYIGEWNNGDRNGDGKLFLVNGKEIKGHFSNGIFGNGLYKVRNLLDIWDILQFWFYKLID